MTQAGKKAGKNAYARLAVTIFLLHPVACVSLPDVQEIEHNRSEERGQHLVAGQHGLLSPNAARKSCTSWRRKAKPTCLNVTWNSCGQLIRHRLWRVIPCVF